MKKLIIIISIVVVLLGIIWKTGAGCQLAIEFSLANRSGGDDNIVYAQEEKLKPRLVPFVCQEEDFNAIFREKVDKIMNSYYEGK